MKKYKVIVNKCPDCGWPFVNIGYVDDNWAWCDKGVQADVGIRCRKCGLLQLTYVPNDEEGNPFSIAKKEWKKNDV